MTQLELIRETATKPTRSSTELSSWLNHNPRIASKGAADLRTSIMDVDFFIHAFKLGTFLLLEEKRYGQTVPYSQGDNYNTLAMNLRGAVGYRGAYCIEFDGSGPRHGFKIFRFHEKKNQPNCMRLIETVGGGREQALTTWLIERLTQPFSRYAHEVAHEPQRVSDKESELRRQLAESHGRNVTLRGIIAQAEAEAAAL